MTRTNSYPTCTGEGVGGGAGWEGRDRGGGPGRLKPQPVQVRECVVGQGGRGGDKGGGPGGGGDKGGRGVERPGGWTEVEEQQPVPYMERDTVGKRVGRPQP